MVVVIGWYDIVLLVVLDDEWALAEVDVLVLEYFK